MILSYQKYLIKLADSLEAENNEKISLLNKPKEVEEKKFGDIFGEKLAF